MNALAGNLPGVKKASWWGDVYVTNEHLAGAAALWQARESFAIPRRLDNYTT
jgi:hypothetical protein